MAQTHKRRHKEAAEKSFRGRYNMTRSEWTNLKREDPQKAHEIRMRVQG